MANPYAAVASDGPVREWYEVSCTMDPQVAKGVEFRTMSCCAFDPEQELIISGWESGVLTTDYFPTLAQYSSVCAHPTAVKEILPLAGVGVASLSESQVRIHSRGGMVLFTGRLASSTKSNSAKSARSPPGSPTRPTSSGSTASVSEDKISCMALSDTFLASGTANGTLLSFDLSNGGRQTPRTMGQIGHGVTKMCTEWQYRTLVCGGINGQVSVFDPRTRTKTNSMIAHSGSVLDMAINDHLLITCGALQPPLHVARVPNLIPKGDPFVKVFDLRMMRQLAPIQCQQPVSYLKFLPQYSNQVMMVGTSGNVRLADLSGAMDANPTTGSNDMYSHIQSGAGVITSMTVSPNGRVMYMGDSGANMHIWTDISPGEELELTANSPESIGAYTGMLKPPPVQTLGTPAVTPLAHPLHWMDTEHQIAPSCYPLLNLPPSIPGDCLASWIKEPLLTKAMRPRSEPVIHHDLLENVQQRDFIGYIENKHNWNGHALLYGSENHNKAYQDADPRSESGTGEHQHYAHGSGTGSSNAAASRGRESSESGIPVELLQPSLSHSKIGLADFDFSQFNKTRFAGLEADMPNAFVNSLLQLLYFVLPLRKELLGFLSNNRDCLATEAGFLFRMLDQAQNADASVKSCQARNFLRTFRLSPYANALGLMEPTKLEIDRRAGAFLRFLLGHFSAASPHLKSSIEDILGTSFRHVTKWDKAKPSTRNSNSLVLDLYYPNPSEKGKVTFSQLLQKTFKYTRKNKLYCDELAGYHPAVQESTVTRLAPVLMIICSSESRSHLNYWRQGPAKNDTNASSGGGGPKKHFTPPLDSFFLPPYLACTQNKQGGYNVEGLFHHKDVKRFKPHQVYELCSVVSHITRGAKPAKGEAQQSKDGHLVAHIRIPEAYNLGKEHDHELGWMLFNDFAVSPTRLERAVDFSEGFRNPCVVMYKATSQKWQQLEDVPSAISSEVFLTKSVSTATSRAKPTFTQLDPAQLPGKGDLVAIDCEFVALSTEEYEVQSDGTKVVTRQAQLSLARVSCLNGDGVTFIDDYIITPEPVVDYLTRFSGLVPGDLDPQTSPHHLLPLKTVYLKLRHLVDRGCIFVGHGLRKDFRVVNIFVPPQQIVDTVKLYHMEGMRMLSLRFLASYLLKSDIQGEVHDSIEDARTALQLYKKYQEFLENSTFSSKILEIYQAGRERNWK